MKKLVVRVPNWIGDCVMALPALQLLQAHQLKLHVVGRAWCSSLLQSMELTSTTLEQGQRAGSSQLRAFTQQDLRHILLMTHSCSSAAMAKRAGLQSLGFAKDWRGPLLSKRIPWLKETHEVVRYWHLAERTLEWLGIDYERPHEEDWQPPWCQLQPSSSHLRAGKLALNAIGIDGPNEVTLVCPVATGTVKGLDKQWPHFQAFSKLWMADQVSKEFPIAVIAPPGKEKELAAQFPAIPILSNLSMDAFIGVLARAKLVIANDSGPMHLTCAMGKPCLVPFGTGITYPERTGAWSPHLIPLTGGNPWPSAVHALETIQPTLMSKKMD